MYKLKGTTKKRMEVNLGYEGKRIEVMVEAMIQNNEPIGEKGSLRYTEKSEGVRADMNIRTDKFAMAVDAMDVSARAERAKGRGTKPAKVVPIEKKEDTKGESTEATKQ